MPQITNLCTEVLTNSNPYIIKTTNENFETTTEKVVTRAKIFYCSDAKIDTIDIITDVIKHESETIVHASHAMNA